MTFGTCTSDFSFRSGPNVLGAVDAVFGQPAAFAGLSADAVKTVHEPLPDATPGLVEIWPPSSPRTSARSRPGTRRSTNYRDEPAGAAGRQDRAQRHGAGRRARARATCSFWCASAERCSKRSSARSRTRNPVAGADRLVLTEHIAVMDLMVLADALLLPDDDLALATVLKSPLFGLDDDDLFKLA